MLFRSNDTATTEIYTTVHTLSLHDALPISKEVPAVDRKVWEPNPYWHFFRHVDRGIKIRHPPVEIHALRPHEVRAAPEDQILIFLGYELEYEESSSNGIAGHTILHLGSLVTLDPVIGGFCRGPEPQKLSYQSSFS